MVKMKKITVRLGDVFTFPLNNGLNCFGQVICFNSEHKDLLLILFDFVSKDVPDLQNIVRHDILGIANMDDSRIAQGEWKIVGNTDVVATNIILPCYLGVDNSISQKPIIKSYLGEFVRFATRREFDNALDDTKGVNLKFWTSHDSYCFLELAQSVFCEHSQVLSEFKDRLFSGSMWDASSNPDGIELQTYLKNIQISIPEKVDFLTYEVIIEIQFDSAIGPRELEMRNRIEDVVRLCLQNTKNGEVVGTETGQVQAYIFCIVQKPKLAVSSIDEELKIHGFRNRVSEIKWSRV
jgi:hypothetical protein